MNKSKAQKKLRSMNIKQPMVPSMPQRLQATFAKKLSNLFPGPDPIPSNILSILDKGSESNQQSYAQKQTQNTYQMLSFTSQAAYIRQKLLLQTLNMMGKCHQSQSSIVSNLKPQTNYQWNYQNPRYPYLKAFSDEDLVMEIEVGKVRLDELQKERVECGDRWLDREIQFLMKSLCKSVLELYNCGIFCGNIGLDKIYLRQNMIGCYEPVLAEFGDATNDFETINNFNPKFWNYLNKEVKEFSSKEERLSQELYQVGRTIQRCMLDLNTKHEDNLFKNQTNIGIERCLNYFRTEKSSQFSSKTIECLQILLQKGDLGLLIKRFKKFNKDQMIADDNMKLIDKIFNQMCNDYPPIEFQKTIGQVITSDASVKNKKIENISLNSSEQQGEIEQNNQNNNNNNNNSNGNLEKALKEMKKSQIRKESMEESQQFLVKKCEKKRQKRKKQQSQNSSGNESQQYDENDEFLEKDYVIGKKEEKEDDSDSVLDEIEILRSNYYYEKGEAQSDWDVLSQQSRMSCFEEM